MFCAFKLYTHEYFNGVEWREVNENWSHLVCLEKKITDLFRNVELASTEPIDWGLIHVATLISRESATAEYSTRILREIRDQEIAWDLHQVVVENRPKLLTIVEEYLESYYNGNKAKTNAESESD